MTQLVTFDGIGLATGATLAAGQGGPADTPCSGYQGSAAATVKATKISDDPEFSDAFHMNFSATNQQAWALWNLPDGRNFGARLYVKKMSANAGGNTQFSSFLNSNGGVNAVRMSLTGTSSPGSVRIYQGSGTANVGTPNNVVQPNVWYRYEYYVKSNPNADSTLTDGQARFLVYSLAGDLLHDSGWLTGSYGDISNAFRFGIINNVTSPDALRFAHISVTDNADQLIGPWADSPTTPTLSRSFIKTETGLKPVSLECTKTSSGLRLSSTQH